MAERDQKIDLTGKPQFEEAISRQEFGKNLAKRC